MQPQLQTTATTVLGQSTVADHPSERLLAGFAGNEMGPQRKKVVARHLEICADCRKVVARHHAISSTFRDWERLAIAQGAREMGRER
jgi:anti-sigma factor ChrR (cupin superfamily)